MAVDLYNSSDSFFTQQPMNPLHWSSPSLSHVSSPTNTSPLCSPHDTESETTESDHADDYIAELTRQMAHSMFSDFDDINTIQPAKEEPGTLEKQRILMGPVEESNGEFIDSSPVSELQKKQALIDEQIRSVQVQRLKQEEAAIRKPKQQQQQGKGRYNRRALGNEPADNNNNPSSFWTNPPQQQSKPRVRSAVTRAVFLGDSGRTGSTGTGVFLPRGAGNPSNPAESRKKPGYSTVLMPARVVQALKLHFDKMASGTDASTLDPPPAAAAAASNLPLSHDAVTGNVRYAFLLQQKGQSVEAKQSKNHHRHNNNNNNHRYQEMGLPQEWTY